jgi:hypothetical protein
MPLSLPRRIQVTLGLALAVLVSASAATAAPSAALPGFRAHASHAATSTSRLSTTVKQALSSSAGAASALRAATRGELGPQSHDTVPGVTTCSDDLMRSAPDQSSHQYTITVTWLLFAETPDFTGQGHVDVLKAPIVMIHRAGVGFYLYNTSPGTVTGPYSAASIGRLFGTGADYYAFFLHETYYVDGDTVSGPNWLLPPVEGTNVYGPICHV